jgi:hypothetical protein
LTTNLLPNLDYWCFSIKNHDYSQKAQIAPKGNLGMDFYV